MWVLCAQVRPDRSDPGEPKYMELISMGPICWVMQDGKVLLSVQIVGRPVPGQPSRRQRCVGVSKGLVTHAVCRLQGTCAAEQPQHLSTPSNNVLPLQSHEQDLVSEEAVYPTCLSFSSAVLGFVKTEKTKYRETEVMHVSYEIPPPHFCCSAERSSLRLLLCQCIDTHNLMWDLSGIQVICCVLLFKSHWFPSDYKFRHVSLHKLLTPQ